MLKKAIVYIFAILASAQALSLEAEKKVVVDKKDASEGEGSHSSNENASEKNSSASEQVKEVSALSKIYGQFGYGSHQKLAELAVKHDLDRGLLSKLNAKITPLDLSDSWLNRVEVDGERITEKNGFDFPYQIKCSEYDKRIIHLCIKAEYFKPKISAYYDRGKDKDGKVDLFKNGSATVSVDLVSVYVPWRFGHSEYFDNWYWGPTIGLGISSSSAQVKTKNETNVDDEATTASIDSSPVALFSFGLRSAYAPKGAGGFSFGVEIGGVRGYSTNENLSDKSDKAAYLGFSLNVPLSGKATPD